MDTIVNNAMNIVDVKDYSINTSIAYSLKNFIMSKIRSKFTNKFVTYYHNKMVR